MANVGLKKIRKYPLEREAILAQHDVYRTMAITEHDVDHAEVVLLAERLKLSAYDASYLCLARSLGIELVTLDDKLNKAAAKI
jgi:predicted nucleic acid-binding protein